MELKELLERKEAAILQNWLTAIFNTYPAGSTDYCKGEDMFTNPVGHNIKTNAGRILEGLIRGDDDHVLSCYIEQIIRIRAVQDFTPSQAAGFMIDLKTAIRSQIMGEATKHGLIEDLMALEKRIEGLGYISDDLYANMKRKIRELAVREAKKDNDFKARIAGIKQS